MAESKILNPPDPKAQKWMHDNLQKLIDCPDPEVTEMVSHFLELALFKVLDEKGVGNEG